VVDLYILDRRGRPVPEPDERVWAEAFESDPRWQIDHSEWLSEQGRVTVDTRFLGFDPRRKEERTGVPTLFATAAMLQPSDDGEIPERIDSWLYQSRPAALRGHEQLVRNLSGGGGIAPPGGDGTQ